MLGVAIGGAYLLLGMLGFTVTDGVGFFAPEGGLLFGLLQVNGMHNLLHLALGAVLLLAGLRGIGTAKPVNAILGAVFLALGLAGLFLVGTPANVFALNVADNALHFATAVVLLAVGLGAEPRTRPAAS